MAAARPMDRTSEKSQSVPLPKRRRSTPAPRRRIARGPVLRRCRFRSDARAAGHALPQPPARRAIEPHRPTRQTCAVGRQTQIALDPRRLGLARVRIERTHRLTLACPTASSKREGTQCPPVIHSCRQHASKSARACPSCGRSRRAPDRRRHARQRRSIRALRRTTGRAA